MGIAAQSGGITKAVNYGIKTVTQVVISLKELIDPEDKTEIGKPTIPSLDTKAPEYRLW